LPTLRAEIGSGSARLHHLRVIGVKVWTSAVRCYQHEETARRRGVDALESIEERHVAPKKVNTRKRMKGRRKGTAWRGSGLAFGTSACRRPIAAGSAHARSRPPRVALTRHISRGGRVMVRIFGQAAHQ